MGEREAVPTPDGRYLVIDGLLWRATNPNLEPGERQRLVDELMAARRGVHADLKLKEKIAEREARGRVHGAKVALGERGPVWWSDGAPDLTRRRIENSPYADWHRALTAQ